MLRILYGGTKLAANSRNSIQKHSAEKKTRQIPFGGTKIEVNTWHSFPIGLMRKRHGKRDADRAREMEAGHKRKVIAGGMQARHKR